MEAQPSLPSDWAVACTDGQVTVTDPVYLVRWSFPKSLLDHDWNRPHPIELYDPLVGLGDLAQEERDLLALATGIAERNRDLTRLGEALGLKPPYGGCRVARYLVMAVSGSLA